MFIFSLILNVVTYTLILGIININGLIALPKYPIKYLEIVSVLTNLEMTILSTLISQIFIRIFAASNYFSLSLSLSLSKSHHYYTMEKFL